MSHYASSDILNELLQKIFTHGTEIIVSSGEDGDFFVQKNRSGAVEKNIVEKFHSGVNPNEKYVVEYSFKIKTSSNTRSDSAVIYVVCKISTLKEFLLANKITVEKIQQWSEMSKKLCENLKNRIANDKMVCEINNNVTTINVIGEETPNKFTYTYMTFTKDILKIASLEETNTTVLNSDFLRWIQ